jgi:magnesium-transporting ATPase (P-type)
MNNEFTKKIVSGSTKLSWGLSILTAVFAVLKLTHVISWSWLWVFSPIWIQFLVSLSIFIVAILFIAIVNIFIAIANKTEK